MKTSENGISLIKSFEGLRLAAYRDSVGVATIGWGTTKGVKMGMVITKDNAEKLLRDDVARFDEYLADLVKVPVSQNQWDALSSFIYNLGPSNLGSSTLLEKLNAGDYQGAADQFLRWVYAGKKKLRGLETRRSAERAMFLGA